MNRLTAIFLSLGLGLAPAIALAMPSPQPDQLLLKQSVDPPERGAPESRDPFGSRGPCAASDRPFTPLLPLPNPNFTGNTLAERPTFWFYVPYASDRVSSGQFFLADENGDVLYGADFNLPATPGLVSLKLPDSAPALELNQSYRWELKLYCATEADEESDDLVRHVGLITRISSIDLMNQLATATPAERIALYQQHELWYDLANELSAASPGTELWTFVFQTLELEALSQEAIAGSVMLLN